MVIRRWLGLAAFLALGIVIFLGLQRVFVPTHGYTADSQISDDAFKEFYRLVDEDADIPVYFLGTSHPECGIDPMWIYVDSGITTFNLSTVSQGFQESYYLMEEIFTRQNPKVIMLDVAKLFNPRFDMNAYRSVMDNMRMGGAKVDFAGEYASHFSEAQRTGAFLSAFIPFYTYHDRWEGLTARDFQNKEDERLNYYSKGFSLESIIVECSDEEWMNATAEKNSQYDGWKRSYIDGGGVDLAINTKLYNPRISSESRQWLCRMKELCDENGAELILIKIPVIGLAIGNSTVWTKERSEATKELARELDVRFVDLLYDVDFTYDWSEDSQDGGAHMNYWGAQKVSSYLGRYLREQCGITEDNNLQFEEDIPLYSALCRQIALHAETELPDYLKALSRTEDITVFFSAADDMERMLSEESMQALRDYGLQTEFLPSSPSNAFLAVVENGRVSYEAHSNRKIIYSGEIDDEVDYFIVSSGFFAGPQSVIQIDGTDYSEKHRGLNIVVWDNSSHMVLDSVAFDTCGDSQSAVRAKVSIDRYVRQYERYLMKQDYENGIGV